MEFSEYCEFLQLSGGSFQAKAGPRTEFLYSTPALGESGIALDLKKKKSN